MMNERSKETKRFGSFCEGPTIFWKIMSYKLVLTSRHPYTITLLKQPWFQQGIDPTQQNTSTYVKTHIYTEILHDPQLPRAYVYYKVILRNPKI